jgi:hypothetical protein
MLWPTSITGRGTLAARSVPWSEDAARAAVIIGAPVEWPTPK